MSPPFPPEAPMATLSPGENKLLRKIVSCISCSNNLKKQFLQTADPYLIIKKHTKNIS